MIVGFQVMVMSEKQEEQAIVRCIRGGFPSVQAIYLFGSRAVQQEAPVSDVDLAILLPPSDRAPITLKNPVQEALQELTGHDVDLINLRQAPTVLQKEVVMTGRRIYCADELAADEFDIGVMSRYQKLNEERAEILREFQTTGRAYDV